MKKNKKFLVVLGLGVFLIAALMMTLANAKKVPYVSNGVPYGG